MGLTALGMVGARQLTVGDARRPVALMTAGFGCGQMVGPAVAGFLHDASGSFLLPSLCAVASLVLASVLAVMRGAGRSLRIGEPSDRVTAVRPGQRGTSQVRTGRRRPPRDRTLIAHTAVSAKALRTSKSPVRTGSRRCRCSCP